MNEESNNQSVNNPHDAVFRSAFRDREVAENFFRHYLPEQFTKHIDFTALEIADGTYVDEKLKDKHSDIVYKTRIDGLTAFLYILFEHQSSPDPMMAFRILCYMVNLWKEYTDQQPETRLLPFVMPLVLYHGAKKWTSPMYFREMFKDKNDKDSSWDENFSVFIPDFTYKLYDLSKYPDDMLMLGNSMALAAVLHIFKHIFDEDFNRHASRSFQLLAQSPNKQNMLKFLEILLRYIYHARNDGDEVVKQYIDQGLQHFDDEKVMEVVMTIAERIKQQGMLQEGREMVMEAIETRFEKIPEDISSAIREITDRNTLKSLLRNTIMCSDIEMLRKKLLKAE